MLEIGFAVTLSPTPLPSRERGSIRDTNALTGAGQILVLDRQTLLAGKIR